MSTYIVTDDSGQIIASSNEPFPNSIFCSCEVVRYPDGRLYRTDSLPPVYAVPGFTDQRIGGECPDGYIVMSGPRPEDIKNTNGFVITTWIADDTGVWVPVSTMTLEIMKANKLAEINTLCDDLINALVSTYPKYEISTFDKQEIEARAYMADATASTPLLIALATARGISLSDLVNRVVTKADAFAKASGFIIGQCQALKDRLDTCTTIEEVQAITIDITIPDREILV